MVCASTSSGVAALRSVTIANSAATAITPAKPNVRRRPSAVIARFIDVIEGGAGGRGNSGRHLTAQLLKIGKQADLAEVTAGAEIVEHQVVARDFDEAGADQVKGVGTLPFADDLHLGIGPDQIDFGAQQIDELGELVRVGVKKPGEQVYLTEVSF